MDATSHIAPYNIMITFLRKPVFHLLLILTLGILAYSNTFNAPFIFDDKANIVDNPIIKNMDYYVNPAKAKVFHDFAEYPLLVNRYIGSLSFALNYKMHGLDVGGYHIVNLVIHLINALLIYWFIHLLAITLESSPDGKKNYRRHASTLALFTSLLFVTHPIQTQAVTYIVQRFASLATMFYLFSITMYVMARLMIAKAEDGKHGKRDRIKALIYYLTALFAAVLGMKTKEIVFTLPAMILLFEFIFVKDDLKKKLLYSIPFISTMLIIPFTLIFIVNLSGAIDAGIHTSTSLSGANVTRFDYLFTEFRVIITYIRLIFFPFGQNLDYDYPLYNSLFNPQVFWSFLTLLISSLTIIYFFRRYRKEIPLIKIIFFGTVWLFITLSIESSVIPIIDVIFEHRMYLPSLGIFMVVSTLLVLIIEKGRKEWIERAVFLSVITIALILTGITYARNNVWNDKIIFWQDVVAKSPEKARGYTNLGLAHEERGNPGKALEYFQKAGSLEPYNTKIHVHQGMVLAELDRNNEALDEFKKALQINPANAKAHIKLGTLFAKLGRKDEAKKKYLDATAHMTPYKAENLSDLGIFYYEYGLKNSAIKQFRAALRINPDSVDSRNYLKLLEG